MDNISLYNDDCMSVMCSLSDASVDLIFADPPFNLDKNYAFYRDNIPDYYSWCSDWLTECWRILAPTGSLWLMTIQDHLIVKGSILYALGGYLRNMVIWHNSSMPVKNRFCIGYQPLLWFTKDVKNYTFNYGVQKRHSDAALPYGRTNKAGSIKDIWDDIKFVSGGCMASKEAILLPGTKKKIHPTQMPMKLFERILVYCTNPGDVVFDPFMGSGTSAVVSKEFDRVYIGSDVDATYVELTKNRLEGMYE